MDKNLIKVIAVGDLLMGDHPVTSGHGVDSIVIKKGPNFFFEQVSTFFNDGDIVMGNLEAVVSDLGRDPKNFISNCFRGRSNVAKALSHAGFNVLSLANNHIMQHGKESLYETMSLLNKNNIKYCGINEVDPTKSEPIYIKKKDLIIAILGYSCISQQYNLNIPVVCQGTYRNIKSDIAKIREKVDFIILTLHWGDEFIDRPSPIQIKLGRNLIDAGADIILGHHSHVLQGIERYKNGVIVYSLGSFVKDLWQVNMRESIIFQCQLSSDGITDLNYIPIYINDKYKPEFVSGNKAEKILGRLNKLSAELEKEDLSFIKEKEKEYKNHVKKLLKKDRRDTYLHYLSNIFSYDPKMLIMNFWLMIKRRIVRKNI